MMIYFFDADKKYIGSRKLNEGESVPQNATIVPVTLKDGEQAHLIDDKWVVSAIPAESMIEVISTPSLDERVGTVEVTTDEIVDVLATIVGV